jgi:hypothetical protein
MDSLVLRENPPLIQLVKTLSPHDALKIIDTDIKLRQPGEQLAYCEDVLHTINEAATTGGYIAYHVCEYISDHLRDQIDCTWTHYQAGLDCKYPTAIGLARSVREKVAYQAKAEKIWGISSKELFGPIYPEEELGRDASRHLYDFAKKCTNAEEAKSMLEKAVQERQTRSYVPLHFRIPDIIAAIKAVDRQKEVAVLQAKEQAKNAEIHPKKRLRSATTARSKKAKRLRSATTARSKKAKTGPPGKRTPGIGTRTGAANIDEAEEDSRDGGSRNDQNSSGDIDEFIPEKLRDARRLLFHIPNVLNLVEEELVRLERDVPPKSWGEDAVKLVLQLLRGLEPATLYIPDIPPGHICGGHRTATRGDADVLLLREDEAKLQIDQGPPDGKPVAVLECEVRRMLPTINNGIEIMRSYRTAPISVQDPTQMNNAPSAKAMDPMDVFRRLENIKNGNKIVGYQDNQESPINLLELPAQANDTPYLMLSNVVRIHEYLRKNNDADTSRNAQGLKGDLIAAHMAISLGHRDHDGLGIHARLYQGYKLWITWPNLTPEEHKQFQQEGIDFCGGKPKYMLLGPEYRWVQSPVKSQDLHAVVSIGYCGVSKCVEQCIARGYPKCNGLIGMEFLHYWHAYYLADSVKSTTQDMLAKHTTNQDPHPDFRELMQNALILIGRDPTPFGGKEKYILFREALRVG